MTDSDSDDRDYVRDRLTHSDHPEDHFAPEILGQRYQFFKYLGHGSYGHVAAAVDRNTGARVAIKKVMNPFANTTEALRILREIRILRLCNHENIIKIIDLLCPIPDNKMTKDSDLFIIFEFVDTDMDKLFRSNQHFQTLHIQYMFYQVLLGLYYLHTARIVHRDVKPANILINEDCSIKICDFGLARWMGELPTSVISLQRALTDHVVTRWYRAPEVILVDNQYSESIDLWSCGCVLAEMLNMQKENCSNYKNRKPLCPGNTCFPLSADHDRQFVSPQDQLNVIFSVIGTPSIDDINTIRNIQTRTYLKNLPYRPKIDFAEKYPGADPLALDILSKLLQFNPDKRITILEALSHPFLAEQRVTEKEVVGPFISPSDFEFDTTSITKSKLLSLIQNEVDWYHLPHNSSNYKNINKTYNEKNLELQKQISDMKANMISKSIGTIIEEKEED